jgi:hypothetical protein
MIKVYLIILIMVSVNEYDVYTDTIDNIEEMIEDDSKFPVVEDGRIKMLLKMIFEFIKVVNIL